MDKTERSKLNCVPSPEGVQADLYTALPLRPVSEPQPSNPTTASSRLVDKLTADLRKNGGVTGETNIRNCNSPPLMGLSEVPYCTGKNSQLL